MWKEKGLSQDCTFAFVIGVQHEGDILEDDDNGERPEDERHAPQNVSRLWGGRKYVGVHIQWGGSQSPIDYAD